MKWHHQRELTPQNPHAQQRIEEMPPQGEYVHECSFDDMMMGILSIAGILAVVVVLIGATLEAYLQ